MNTCRTCKHWVQPDHYDVARGYTDPWDIDTGEPMQMPFKVLQCKHPALTFCERPVEVNGFGVCDGSTYQAALFTGEEFGCVRHEAP